MVLDDSFMIPDPHRAPGAVDICAEHPILMTLVLTACAGSVCFLTAHSSCGGEMRKFRARIVPAHIFQQ